MKESTTTFDGTYFVYKCPHCGIKCEEPANPKTNPQPFSFLPRCRSCQAPKEPDWDVIDKTHKSYQT